jgi:hypothetical protein
MIFDQNGFENDDPQTWNAVVWRLLARAAQDNTSALRHAVIASSGLHGAQARVVLLREAVSATRTLTLFTDARSSKVGELRNDPRMAWTFWDERLKLQVRAQSMASVHQGDERANIVSRQVPQHAWRDYTSIVAPGQRSVDPAHDAALFTANFCVIDAHVKTLDILALRSSKAGGHKRLHIDYVAGEQAWLVP